MFSDILLTVDFDRTLTAPDTTIPQRNLEAIAWFMANGGTFTVNTGRSVPMTRPFLDQISVNAPLLLYNGSAAYDPANFYDRNTIIVILHHHLSHQWESSRKFNNGLSLFLGQIWYSI